MKLRAAGKLGPRGRLPSLAAAALAGLMALALALPPGQAQPADGPGGSTGDTPAVTVLLFHPDDGVDPLGFSVAGNGSAGGDPFALRYGPLVADKGRFDFPFFVADGVVPIEAIPDPAKPFASVKEAYTLAIEERRREEAPAELRLASLAAEGQAVVQVEVLRARAPLADEDLHLRVALVEDHVEYQPPPGLTNGVTDHRFTVRAYADLGRVGGAQGGAGGSQLGHAFPLAEGWDPAQLSVAAWLQQDAPSPRFAAREVAQATHAPLGDEVLQVEKGVLVEMLSATWCDPCLFGDRAVEEIAVSYGVAEASSERASLRYLDLDARDAVAAAAAAALGIGVAALVRRRG